MSQAGDNLLPVRVYTPESPLRHPLQMAREMAADLVHGRELAWRLLVRNIQAEYRQTLLGYAWAVLPPLVTTAIWVFLNGQRIINFDSGSTPYPVFVLTGVLLYGLFTDALQAPLMAITQSKQMLAKINFPRESLLLLAAGQTAFNFLIKLLLLVPVLIYFDTPLTMGTLWALFGAGALALVGLTLGLVLVPLGSLYGDVGRGVGIAAGVWLYLTPVVYPAPTSWPGLLINWLNPVSGPLCATRDWLLQGTTPHGLQLAVVFGGALPVLLLALLIYRLAMPILIERMSA